MTKNLKGPLLVFASGIVWSFSGVLSKGFAWNGISKTGVRGLIAVLMFALYRKSFKFRLTRATLIGAMGVCLTSLLYLSALMYTTSANAIVLQYTMPIYVVAFNWLYLKQKPGYKELVAVPLVLVGVSLCCLSSLGTGAALGNLLALAAGAAFSLVYIAPKLGDTDSLSYTYVGNVCSALLVLLLPFDENIRFGLREPALTDWLRILLMGLSLGGGYLLLALGLKEGTSAINAALLSNIEPVANPIWVYAFLGEMPNAAGIIGCAVVLFTVTLYSCIPELKKGIA